SKSRNKVSVGEPAEGSLLIQTLIQGFGRRSEYGKRSAQDRSGGWADSLFVRTRREGLLMGQPGKTSKVRGFQARVTGVSNKVLGAIWGKNSGTWAGYSLAERNSRPD